MVLNYILVGCPCLKYQMKTIHDINAFKKSLKCIFKPHILQWWFRLHYAVTWIEKPLGLFWLFRPSTADITIRYTTSSITFKDVVEKLEQSWATVYTEYCQNRGQKKPAGKNPGREKNSAGNLGRIHGSCSEKPILRRLHGWKDFALIYKTSIPTKDGKL